MALRVPRSASEALRLAPAILGGYAIVGGALSFAGWVFDVARLTDWYGNGISIQPNAAIAAATAGLALVAITFERRRLATVCGVALALIGLSVWFEYASGVSLGIDDLFVFDRPWGHGGVLYPGRMGPPGATSWSALGIAITITGLQRRPLDRPPTAVLGLSVLTAGISTLSLIGYAYGASAFYTIPFATVIAFQTSTFILAVSVGLLLSFHNRGLTLFLLDDGPAGLLVRRVVPVVLAAPFVLGYLRVLGERAGLYDSPFGSSARTVLEIALLLGVLWLTAQAIRRQSAAREAAESRVRTNEHRLRTIFETVAVSLWELDMKDACTGIDDLRARGVTDIRRHAGDNPGFVKDAVRRIRVLDVNGTAVRMCGATQKPDLLGPLPGVFGPESETVFAEAIVAIAERRSYLGAETLLWPLNGDPIYVFMTMALPGAGDPYDRVILSVFDLTDRKRGEEALRQSEASLREADRRKTELLDTLAHELRNPLAALRTGADLLKRQPALGGEMDWAADVIDRQTALMAQLLNDLLKVEGPILPGDRSALAPVKSPPPPAPPASVADGPVRRILVVDDNADAASSLALLLGLNGHQTHAAFDGPEAIEMAIAVRPDVILLDLGLPKLDGYEVCRYIRQQPWGNDVVIIALTGWGQDADRRKTREAGFDHHIVKPIEHARLIELVVAGGRT